MPGSTYTDENVAPGTHDYEVHAWDNDGKKVLATYTGTVTVIKPFEPDTGPLTATVDGTTVTLDWADYTDGNGWTNFRIYRDDELKVSWTKNSDYVEQSVPVGTHTYVVHAWNNTDGIILRTYTAEVVIQKPFEPDTGPLTANVDGTTVTLDWADYTDGNGFSFYRVYVDGTLVSGNQAASSYDAGTFNQGAEVAFKVEAWDNTAKRVLRTYETTATIPNIAEPQAYASVSGNTVTLTWDDVSNAPGFTNYRVYRDGSPLTWWVLEETYVDADLEPGTYQYEIVARDNPSNSSLFTMFTSATVVETGDNVIIVEIDPWIQWDGYIFRCINNGSSSPVASVQLTLEGGGGFDSLGPVNGLSVSPEIGGNDPVRAATILVTFSTPLASGQSIQAGAVNDYELGDIDGTWSGITTTITLQNGQSFTGALVNVGDSDDDDSRLLRFSTGGSGPAVTATYFEAEAFDQ